MKYLITTITTAFLFIMCGCTSIDTAKHDPAAPQRFSENDVENGKLLAEKYINALVKAVQKNDFNEISPYLKADMLSIRQKKSVFNDMCKRFSMNGKIISHNFVGVFDQTLCKDYIWQINFEKQTSSTKLPVIKTVMLYSIRIVMAGKTPEIVRARPIQL